MEKSQKKKGRIHRCEYCQEEFPDYYKLRDHGKTHFAKTKFKCSFCTYKTNAKAELYNHIRSHTKERPFKCQQPNCKMAFSSKSNLGIHQLVHRRDDENVFKFKCSKCPYISSRKSNLKDHLKSHSDIKNFACGLCSYRSQFKSNVRRHYNSVHVAEPLKPFKCQEPNCNLAFQRKCELRRHQFVHNREDESVNAFQCSQCPFKSLSRSGLSRHLKNHSEDKPFACDLCPFKTNHENSLKGHRDHMHLKPKLKPFKCPNENCCYSCKRSGSLKRHLQMHVVVKSFFCSVPGCFYKTRWLSALKSHGMIHRNERPFKCNLCTSAFRQKGKLFDHIRRHTGEAPYSCPKCRYRAKSWEGLARHGERHHLEKRSRFKTQVFPSNQATKTFSLTCKIPGCAFTARSDSILAGHLNFSHQLPRVVLLQKIQNNAVRL